MLQIYQLKSVTSKLEDEIIRKEKRGGGDKNATRLIHGQATRKAGRNKPIIYPVDFYALHQL